MKPDVAGITLSMSAASLRHPLHFCKEFTLISDYRLKFSIFFFFCLLFSKAKFCIHNMTPPRVFISELGPIFIYFIYFLNFFFVVLLPDFSLFYFGSRISCEKSYSWLFMTGFSSLSSAYRLTNRRPIYKRCAHLL